MLRNNLLKKASNIKVTGYILPVLFTVLLPLYSYSQSGSGDYKTAGGIRLGFYPGITVKHKLEKSAALEGILSSRYNGLIITGLYEIQAPAFTSTDLRGFQWYYGGGAHIGTFGTGSYKNRNGVLYSTTTFTLGVDFILGLEYKMEEIPFLIGLDIKPFFDLVNPGRGYWDSALSFRYIFK